MTTVPSCGHEPTDMVISILVLRVRQGSAKGDERVINPPLHQTSTYGHRAIGHEDWTKNKRNK